MPERHPYLCPGVTEEILRLRLVKAIRYWSNLTTTLLPDLRQIQALHRRMFHGCLRGSVAGRLKRKANFMGTAQPSSPAYVKKDYAILVENARKLLTLIQPPPPEKPDPHNPAHWPAEDDHRQWRLRALYVAYFHVHLIHIHPFEDGNGRVTRLIAWEQARRLFPCVCADHLYGADEAANQKIDAERVGEVDQKTNRFHFPGRDPAAAAEYLAAMEGFKPLNINYVPIVRYFMFQGDRTQVPAVLDEPHFTVHHHKGQLDRLGKPNPSGTRPPDDEAGDMDPEPPYEEPCPPLDPQTGEVIVGPPGH